MKKSILYLLPVFCLFFYRSYGQTPFLTADSVNINNINARVLVHGDMFWNPNTQLAACEFPKGSGKHINFTSALWMSGYDAGNQLHVAAQTYRQDGNDYWPGPLDAAADSIDQPTSQRWAKIWRIDRWDISYFLSLGTHTTANTPNAILTWPAKGNVNAAGNTGIPLTITDDMAPFVDLNGNGIYEPLQGEYPDIRGDLALWWVFNDHGPRHNQSNGRPLGVEIHAMAYGYNRGTLIDNVVYFDYNIVNKSPNTYHNFRMSLFDDADLGFYNDDFLGFDSTWRMAITYNGASDDGITAGHPANSYGTHIPVTGITMISIPGDTGSNYTPAGSFLSFYNDLSVIGVPTNDTQYNYYIRGFKKDGTSRYFPNTGFTFNSMDSAHHCGEHDSTHFYCYTGDPSDTTACSECSLSHAPVDARFVFSTNDFTLAPGSRKHVLMAQVTTWPDSAGGCSGTSFDSIRIVADTAWANYYNPPPSLLGTSNVFAAGQLRVYPNPAHSMLFIESNGNATAIETITLCNVLGQQVAAAITLTGNTAQADISSLPGGLYLIECRAGTSHMVGKFLKE